MLLSNSVFGQMIALTCSTGPPAYVWKTSTSGAESPLPGPISGPTPFARRFSENAPRDTRGRSLRDLDLTQRLLKYPCSYLIYSEAFDALPAEAKDAVYQRLWQVLNGHATDARYSALSADDRTAIVEILRDTKKDLPSYWMASRGE